MHYNMSSLNTCNLAESNLAEAIQGIAGAIFEQIADIARASVLSCASTSSHTETTTTSANSAEPTSSSSSTAASIPVTTTHRKKVIDIPRLKDLLDANISITKIARELDVSRPTLYRIMNENNLVKAYSSISDNDLDDVVRSVKERHPAAGEKMMRGHLAARKTVVQRRRLRSSLHRVDSASIAARRLSTIERRCFSVPAPNYLWHIDGTHKLIRWKLVIHAGIDAFSRLITYCHCSPNNQATTVLGLFREAVESFGLPLKVRSDYGGENVLVWNYMLEKHLNSNSVITGSSVHNQRIERFNRDINCQVLNHYVNVFTHMEELGLLEPENECDLFVLHFVFLRIINAKLKEFQEACNNHPISTSGCSTPKQLHLLNLRLLQHQQLNPSGAITLDEISHPSVNTVHVNAPTVPLRYSELRSLERLVAANADKTEISLYKLVSEFVNDCLTTRV